jgi:hypothetical protein
VSTLNASKSEFKREKEKEHERKSEFKKEREKGRMKE